MTVPLAAAWTAVPLGTPMSSPGCRVPQRIPNGLVIGPETGQMKPELGAGSEPLPSGVALPAPARLARCVRVVEGEVGPAHRDAVRGLERVEPRGLQIEELVQLVQPALVQREIRLQDGELRRDVADAQLEAVDLPRQRRDLRAEPG